MKYSLKTILLSAATVILSSCGTIDNSVPLASDIVGDSIAMNEAYSQSTNAVILKNVLRARDRWPTSFTTLTGIASNPEQANTSGLTLSPLGLGNAVGPFTKSNASFGSNRTGKKSYTVNPFAKDGGNGGLALLKPVNEATFKEYFDSWPSDVVLSMFLRSVTNPHTKEVHSNDGENGLNFQYEIAEAFGINPYAFNPHAFDIENDLALDLRKPEDFACAKKDMKLEDYVGSDKTILDNIEKLEKRFSGSVSLEKSKVTNKLRLKACDTKKTGYTLKLSDAGIRKFSKYMAVDPKQRVNFELRSFDSMIYYLGETLRRPNQPLVKSNCKVSSQGENYIGPIFNVDSLRTHAGVAYATSVKHAGDIYFAIPNDTQLRQQGSCAVERTSTAMSILNQLLLLNQSSKFLEAPENTFIN